MFQVRATVVGFMGNMDLYPCHMKHQVGDEVIFDGESYHGRLCPDVWPLIVPKVVALHQAGPRYVESLSFYPHWYCSPSVPDPAEEKNDGLGFKNVLETLVPPDTTWRNLRPPGSFDLAAERGGGRRQADGRGVPGLEVFDGGPARGVRSQREGLRHPLFQTADGHPGQTT